MIYIQSLLHCLWLIIITKDKLASALVTDALLLGEYMNHVIGSTTGYTCTSAAHTIDDILIRNININCIIDSISKL